MFRRALARFRQVAPPFERIAVLLAIFFALEGLIFYFER
jgi:hypothetical protein